MTSRTRVPRKRWPGLFFAGGAGLDRGREVVAEEGAALVEGEAFERVEDGAVGRGPPEPAHLGDVSASAFEFEAFGVGVVVKTDRRHPCLRSRVSRKENLPESPWQNPEMYPTKQYRTYEALARELYCTPQRVAAVVDKHRKRKPT